MQYPILVQKIFGFNRYPPGWQLESMHKVKSRKDATAAMEFLHPEGPLFSLIYQLMADEVLFEFPFSSLPVGIMAQHVFCAV